MLNSERRVPGQRRRSQTVRLVVLWTLAMLQVGIASGASALEQVRFDGEFSRGVGAVTAVAVGPNGTIYTLDGRKMAVGEFSADGILKRNVGKKGRGRGKFSKAVDIAVAPSGEVLVADAGQGLIHIFDKDLALLGTFGSSGKLPGEFRKPVALAVDAFGNIFVADAGNNQVLEFSPRGVLLRRISIADATPRDMALGPRGRIYLLLPELNAIARYDDLGSGARILIRPGKKIPLGSAAQIFVDHRGDVFATVPGKHRVYKFDQNGALLASFGSRGKGPGQFSKPQGVAGNSDDQVVIADSGNARVQILRVEGESGPSLEQLDRSLPVVRLLTSRSLGAGVHDVEWPSVDTFAALGSRSARVVLQQEEETRVLGKPGKSRGQLRTPKGMAIADDGRVLVADTGNHRVQIFDTRGEPSYVFGGRGSEPGMFSAPEDVAINSEGNVYVADTGNHRIQVFSDQGIFLTAFGKKSRGKGAQAEAGAFKDPSGLVIDSANRVLVLDRGNARVQLFSENGDFLRSLGSVPGLSALALDEWGNIYLGSQSCLCVRVFDPQGEKQLLRFGSGADGPAQLTSVTALAVLEDRVQVVDGLTGNSRVFQLFLDGLQTERRISITHSYFVPVFEAGSEDALPRYREAAVAAGLEELAETLNAPVAQLRDSLRIEADEKVDEGEYRIQISVTALDEPEPAVEPAVTPPPPPPKGLGLK